MSQQPHPSGDSKRTPDTLRDARLAQALKHMPDAHMQPDPQARSAVLQAALKSLDTAPALPLHPPGDARGWRKALHWLLGQPGQRLPLTGALASLLIASFVTVMWLGQDVPDANPESVPVSVARARSVTCTTSPTWRPSVGSVA